MIINTEHRIPGSYNHKKYYNFKDYIIKYNYDLVNKYYMEDFKLVPDEFTDHLIKKKADYKYWECIILKFPDPINKYKYDYKDYYFKILTVNDKTIKFYFIIYLRRFGNPNLLFYIPSNINAN